MRHILKTAAAIFKIIGLKVGNIQARILLTLLYFAIFGPFAIAVRLRSDPLGLKHGMSRGWRPITDAQTAIMEEARRQF